MMVVADRPHPRAPPGPDARTGGEPRSKESSISCCREAKDGELVAAILAGERAGFTELVRRYQGPLLRFAMVFVRDRAVAEEVVQDVWVGALDGLGAFEGRASFKAWLFRIAANMANVRRKREARS